MQSSLSLLKQAGLYELEQMNNNQNNIIMNVGRYQNQEVSNEENIKQKNGVFQNFQNSNQVNYQKKFQITGDDTLKQYVHRKVRQELSYILNSGQDTQTSKAGFQKKDIQTDFQGEKSFKFQTKEYPIQNEGVREKALTDFQISTQNFEKCMQNNNACLTEVNLSSQKYKKYQKKKNKQRYFQLYKSQQSPLLIPCNNPTFENRKSYQQVENQNQEEIKKIQNKNLSSNNRLDNQDTNLQLIESQSFIQEKPFLVKSRLRQQSQASPMNWNEFYQNDSQEQNFYDQNQLDLRRSQMKTRVSPRKKSSQDKQLANENAIIDSQENDSQNKPKIFTNKVKRGYSLDQADLRQSEIINPSFLLNCRSNLISYSTDLASDLIDNNTSSDCNNQFSQQRKIMKSELNFNNSDLTDFPQKFEFNDQMLSRSLVHQSSKSPKIINQQLKNQKILNSQDNILDKSLNNKSNQAPTNKKSYNQVEQFSFPILNQKQIKGANTMLANFQKNFNYQQYKNKILEQRNQQQQETNQLRSNSLIYFEENQNRAQMKQSQSNMENLTNSQIKNLQNKQQSAFNSKNKHEINNFYCNLGDIIIENKNISKKNSKNIQYNNIKTIDEEETLLNSLEKSQSQFNKLRKYYYKKYQNI